MKKILFLMSILAIYSCRPNRDCPECYNGTLPVFNGVKADTVNDIALTDIEIDTCTKVVELNDRYVFHITIKCNEYGNAAAWNIGGTILIPAEVNILSYSSENCLIYGHVGTDDRVKTGYLTFTKDTLDRKDSFTMKIETSKPIKTKALRTPNFGVFAFSQIPDAKLCNNYWYWRNVDASCSCGVNCKEADLSFGNISSDWANRKIKATIFNTGNADVNNLKVIFYEDGEITILPNRPQIEERISNIPAGMSKEIEVNFSSLEGGGRRDLNNVQKIRIIIDPKNEKNECNKLDNMILIAL